MERILLVEDDRAMAEALREALEVVNGFRVDVVLSLTEAAGFLSLNRYDLCIRVLRRRPARLPPADRLRTRGDGTVSGPEAKDRKPRRPSLQTGPPE